MGNHVELGETPFGAALRKTKKILDEVAKVAEKEDSLEDILSKIRKVEVGQTEFVPEGTAGALIYRVKRVGNVKR